MLLSLCFDLFSTTLHDFTKMQHELLQLIIDGNIMCSAYLIYPQNMLSIFHMAKAMAYKIKDVSTQFLMAGILRAVSTVLYINRNTRHA